MNAEEGGINPTNLDSNLLPHYLVKVEFSAVQLFIYIRIIYTVSDINFSLV